MDGVTRSLLHALAMSYTLTGCTKDESPARQQAAGTVQGVADSTPATTSARSSPRSDTRAPADAGFDISRAPVVTPRLGKFPYLGLLDGYQATRSDASKDVPFDRYLFIDSVKVIPVDGRLTTIEAEGTRASAQEV